MSMTIAPPAVMEPPAPSASEEERSRREQIREMRETIYAAVADVLWHEAAQDNIIARLANRFHEIDPYFFDARDFKDRAYGARRSHP